MVTVVHGADAEVADLAGRTVNDVRTLYANVFNIGDDTVAKVNGKQVSDSHAVKDGDKLIFDKRADKYLH
jgi:hypothetical protein